MSWGRYISPEYIGACRGGGTGGALGARAPPPHFSPQSMKCPTSTGVHARPTMYQEGVPKGAIHIFSPEYEVPYQHWGTC